MEADETGLSHWSLSGILTSLVNHFDQYLLRGHVLELGCGKHPALVPLLTQTSNQMVVIPDQVVLCDFQPQVISELCHQVQNIQHKCPLDIRVFDWNLPCQPTDVGAYDFVCGSELLYYNVDVFALFRTVQSLLKVPTGMMILISQQRGSLWSDLRDAAQLAGLTLHAYDVHQVEAEKLQSGIPLASYPLFIILHHRSNIPPDLSALKLDAYELDVEQLVVADDDNNSTSFEFPEFDSTF